MPALRTGLESRRLATAREGGIKARTYPVGGMALDQRAHTDPLRVERLALWGRAAAASALALGLIGLVGGWVFGLDVVARGGFESLPTIKFNAALGVVLAAVALLLPAGRRPWLPTLLGAAVAAIGAATLSEWWAGWDLGIDEMLFDDSTVSGSDTPGRAFVITCLSFVALGAAIALLRTGGRRRVVVAQVLAVTAGVVSLVSDFGYLARSVARDGLAGATSQPLLAAASLTLLAFAALAAAPGEGLMAVATSRLTGGAVASRLVPVAFAAVSVLAVVVRVGANADLYQDAFATALLAALAVPALLGVIWFVSEQANRVDAAREEVQEALAESEAGFRSLFQDSPVALQLEDLSTVKRYVDEIGGSGVAEATTGRSPAEALDVMEGVEVLDANAAAAVLFGDTGQVLKGVVAHLDGAAAPAFVATKLRAIAEGRTSFDVETMVVTDSGERKTVEVRWAVVPGHEATYDRVVVALADVTAQREAERVLRDARDVLEGKVRERTAELETTAEQLQRSNDELQRFAYIASHDLQEPLRKIVSFSNLLVEEIGDSLGDDAALYVDRVTDASRRMQRLIEDLLAYSRAGGPAELGAVRADAVLNRALEALAISIEESGATITHDPLPTVLANATQLEQVLQNLIGNAIKYRSDAPPVIHVGAEREDGGWRITVSDNGIGFDTGYTDQIFVIFQRLHGKARYGGTGIGLALAKRIVERHGGRIWAESEPGHGSKFMFTLADAGRPSAAVLTPAAETGGMQ